MSEPVLRWAGSKRWLTSLLVQLVPQHRRYYEPFLGAGHLFFAIQPSNAILSDLNEALIETYQAIAADPEAVIEIASSLNPSATGYYAARDQYRRLRNPIRRGAYFLFLNRLCWNGLYRQNKAGHFNVPYGRPKTPRRGQLMDWDAVRKASRGLSTARVSCLDFGDATSMVQAGDFVYLDPPYVLGRDGRIFSEYTATAFTIEDEYRLAREAQRIARAGAYVLVSHAFSEAVLEQYGADFYSLRLSRAQTIAGQAKNRSRLSEVLLVSRALAEELLNGKPQVPSAQVPLPSVLISEGLQYRGKSLKFFAPNDGS